MSTASERLRDRNPLLRLKSQSPKFRDILRRKCHARWRENRWSAIDERRRGSTADEAENRVSDMIKEDLRNLYLSAERDDPIDADDLRLWEESIESELQDDKLKWLMGEYDRVLDDDARLAEMLDDLERVTCPVCRRRDLELSSSSSSVVCACGVRVRTPLNLPQVRESVMRGVDTHNDACSNHPEFSCIDEAGEAHVYLVCFACSAFYTLF